MENNKNNIKRTQFSLEGHLFTDPIRGLEDLEARRVVDGKTAGRFWGGRVQCLECSHWAKEDNAVIGPSHPPILYRMHVPCVTDP